MSVSSSNASAGRFGYISAVTYSYLPRPIAGTFFEPVGGRYRVDVAAVVVSMLSVLTVGVLFAFVAGAPVLGAVAEVRGGLDAVTGAIAGGFDAWRHSVGAYLEQATWSGMWSDLSDWGIERVHDLGAFLSA